MEIQEKVLLMLKGLKKTGVKYKDFADIAGLSVNMIYDINCGKVKPSEERAGYIIEAIKKFYPNQAEYLESVNFDARDRKNTEATKDKILILPPEATTAPPAPPKKRFWRW